MRMTLTPSSLKPEVGIRARTPREVTTLWSEDGSEFESELVDDDLEEEGLSGDGEDGSGQEGVESEDEGALGARSIPCLKKTATF